MTPKQEVMLFIVTIRNSTERPDATHPHGRDLSTAPLSGSTPSPDPPQKLKEPSADEGLALIRKIELLSNPSTKLMLLRNFAEKYAAAKALDSTPPCLNCANLETALAEARADKNRWEDHFDEACRLGGIQKTGKEDAESTCERLREALREAKIIENSS